MTVTLASAVPFGNFETLGFFDLSLLQKLRPFRSFSDDVLFSFLFVPHRPPAPFCTRFPLFQGETQNVALTLKSLCSSTAFPSLITRRRVRGCLFKARYAAPDFPFFNPSFRPPHPTFSRRSSGTLWAMTSLNFFITEAPAIRSSLLFSKVLLP